MRVLYIVHQFLPRHVTGTEQYVRSLALGMRERGHDVHVLAFEPMIQYAAPGRLWFERDEEVDGIPVRRVSIHPQVTRNQEQMDHGSPLAVRLMRRYLEEKDFDLVHVFHLRSFGSAGLLEPIHLGIPIVVNLMDFWFLCPRFTLLRGDGGLCEGPPEGGVGCIDCVDPALWRDLQATGMVELLPSGPNERGLPATVRAGAMTATPIRRGRALVGRRERLFEILQKADAVIAPSEFLKGVFVRNGFPDEAVRRVPYGVDDSRLQGMGGSNGSVRRSRSEGGPLQIGYVGSLTPHKGLHVLIAALRQVAGTGWHLHVHGNPNTHPDYTEELEAVAEDDERITFHGGFEPSELGRVLSTLDLLVVPSVWYENTPFTVLEAQMARLPIVASDLGGISEIVREGVDGMLFEAGNVAALNEVLVRLIRQPELLDGMATGASAVRTLQQNLDDFEAVYGELLGEAGR